MRKVSLKKTFFLNLIMIQLETYKGTKSRHTCPACGSRHCFVRYKDETGEYISSDVGRCNRESKCGYHYTPKQWFADNPTGSKYQPIKRQRNVRTERRQTITAESTNIQTTSFDYIAPEHFKPTLGNYQKNAFVEFLFNLFPDCREEIQSVLKMYFVGTFQDYTCFPSVDRLNRVCRAKLIRFNSESGKRLKGEFDTSSLPAKLKLKTDFHYKQIFFGEHLLSKYPNKPVAVCEAEKTAIIASLCFPEFVWLGSNSKSWLKAERLERVGLRQQIILYSDADGFELWQQIAADARRQGLNAKVSSLIEIHATTAEKASGYDLADYLIERQREINQTNNFVDRYNSKLETVLNDENLKRGFETILAEQKAVLTIDGNLSEAEAERIVSEPENVRRIVSAL